jgi:predicted HTH transcriptional regulator
MGVDKEQFLKGIARPKWRNQSFAYLFNKLKLTQSEGQGIPTMLNSMRHAGCPDPIFDIDSDSVTCILPAHPRHEMIGAQQAIRDKMILGNYQAAIDQLNSLLNKDLYNYRTLDLYCEVVDKLRQPALLFDLLTAKKIIFQQVNPNTLKQMSELLKKGTPEHRRLARQILKMQR